MYQSSSCPVWCVLVLAGTSGEIDTSFQLFHRKCLDRQQGTGTGTGRSRWLNNWE